MRFPRLALAALSCLVLAGSAALAADHADTPQLIGLQRNDARLTDLHVFERDGRLVLALSTNPAIPPGTTEYAWPTDLTLRLHLDLHSEVSFDDDEANATYGGRIVDPDHVSADVVLELSFDRRGRQRLRVEGLPGSARREIRSFVGLRDDPFIRGPRTGRNVASWVVDLPADLVTESQPVILAWATSKVPEIHGPISEMAGRALRSMFPENMDMNEMTPAEQAAELAVQPDVVIFDTWRPAAFPNGRALEDDVVDLVGDARLLLNDAPFPTTNDVPFLDEFPYLAPPQ